MPSEGMDERYGRGWDLGGKWRRPYKGKGGAEAGGMGRVHTVRGRATGQEPAGYLSTRRKVGGFRRWSAPWTR